MRNGEIIYRVVRIVSEGIIDGGKYQNGDATIYSKNIQVYRSYADTGDLWIQEEDNTPDAALRGVWTHKLYFYMEWNALETTKRINSGRHEFVNYDAEFMTHDDIYEVNFTSSYLLTEYMQYIITRYERPFDSKFNIEMSTPPPDAAEPTPEYTDPIINPEPLTFTPDNLDGEYHTDLLPPYDDSAYDPADLPPVIPYELVTVKDLDILDRVCLDHDRIINQFNQIRAIRPIDDGEVELFTTDQEYPCIVRWDTPVYRAIEPGEEKRVPFGFTMEEVEKLYPESKIPYERITVRDLTVLDWISFEGDVVIKFNAVHSIVYCGGGHYAIVCGESTNSPYMIELDTTIYRAKVAPVASDK